MRREPLNLARLADYPLVAIDVETTGLYWYRDELFGVAIAAHDDGSDTMYSGYWDVRKSPRVLATLADAIPRCQRVVNHNIKFDAHFLLNHGIRLPYDRAECTSVRAALLNEHELSYSLDALGQKYTGVGKRTDVYGKLAELFGGKADKSQMKNLHRAPVSLASEYATPDPEIAILLWRHQEKHMADLQQVWHLERELTSVLIDLERNGILIDQGYVESRLRAIGPEKRKLVSKLLKIAGSGFDEKLFNSPKQMRALFGADKADGDGKWYAGPVQLLTTEAGNPSIDADILRLLAETHKDERAELIMKVKKLDKAEQFLNNHIKGHLHNGRVYPNYNQTKTEKGTGTGTGRFSIDDPALQQIPARDVQMASIVRAAFIPEKGEDWCCADWDQFEFRWFAHYVNDPDLNQTYVQDPNSDFHKTVATLTGLPRSPRFAGDANAKQINLGLVFGMGKGKLAAEMGLPHEVVNKPVGGEMKEFYIAGPEAEAVFEKYHAAIPGVRALLEQAASIARARGYVKTAMGRHLRFPGGKFTHKAGGLVFQGTSADCNKAKMIELYHNGHKQGDYRILLSVHDEFDFSLPKGSAKRAEIKQRLETFDGEQCPIKCRIPIRSSVSIGPNWYEASK